MKIPKECFCGQVHEYLPLDRILGTSHGYVWFNCRCNSTLITKIENIAVNYG